MTITGNGTNVITNAGTLTTTDGQKGNAILSTGGNNTIVNSGMVVGSVDLGTGINNFTNAAGGVFLAGPIVKLGSGGSFTNSGIIAPGGMGAIGTLATAGNLVMTSTSQYYVDVDFRTGTSDRLTASGTAVVAGRVYVSLANTGYAASGTHDLPIVTAAGGITLGSTGEIRAQALGTSGGGFLFTPDNTAVATYSLAYPDAQNATLRYTINYAPADLTPTQAKVGQLLNAVQAAPTATTAVLANTLYGIVTTQALGQVYDSLSGEGVTAVQTAALTSFAMNHDVLDDQRAISVGPNAAPFSSDHRASLWVAVRGSREKLNGDNGAHDVDSSGYTVQGGFSLRPSANLVLGATLAYDPQRFSVDGAYTSGKLNSVSGGAYLGFAIDKWRLNADLLYGGIDTSYTRATFVPGVTETARGDFTAHALSSRVEVLRQFDIGHVSLQPFAGATLTHLSLPSFTERSTTGTGTTGTLNLQYSQRDFTDVKSFAGLALTDAVPLSGDNVLLLTAKARWEHDFDPQRVTSVALASAPTFRVDTFGAAAAVDAASFDLRTTLRISNIDITAGARQVTGSRYHQTGGDIGVRFRF